MLGVAMCGLLGAFSGTATASVKKLKLSEGSFNEIPAKSTGAYYYTAMEVSTTAGKDTCGEASVDGAFEYLTNNSAKDVINVPGGTTGSECTGPVKISAGTQVANIYGTQFTLRAAENKVTHKFPATWGSKASPVQGDLSDGTNTCFYDAALKGWHTPVGFGGIEAIHFENQKMKLAGTAGSPTCPKVMTFSFVIIPRYAGGYVYGEVL